MAKNFLVFLLQHPKPYAGSTRLLPFPMSGTGLFLDVDYIYALNSNAIHFFSTKIFQLEK